MENTSENHSKRSLYFQVAGCGASFMLVSVLLFGSILLNWGSNQDLVPEVLRSKLQKGMDERSALQALGREPITGGKEERNDGTTSRWILLSEPGIGSMFTTQFSLVLVFEDGKLQYSSYDWHYQFGESYSWSTGAEL